MRMVLGPDTGLGNIQTALGAQPVRAGGAAPTLDLDRPQGVYEVGPNVREAARVHRQMTAWNCALPGAANTWALTAIPHPVSDPYLIIGCVVLCANSTNYSRGVLSIHRDVGAGVLQLSEILAAWDAANTGTVYEYAAEKKVLLASANPVSSATGTALGGMHWPVVVDPRGDTPDHLVVGLRSLAAAMVTAVTATVTWVPLLSVVPDIADAIREPPGGVPLYAPW